jgi:hypothetical protein
VGRSDHPALAALRTFRRCPTQPVLDRDPAERPRRCLLVNVVAWAVPVEIACLTAAVLQPVLRAGWTDWDDPINFLNNPYYRGLGPAQLRWMLTTGLMGHWIPSPG